MPGQPLNDPARLAALQQTGLMDSPAEPPYDRICRLAQRLLGTPVALISLVDDHRQFFKAALGLSGPVAEKRETPLSHSFCQHVVTTGEPLVVDDAPSHPVVCHNLAIRDLSVMAYLGVPIVSRDSHILGSFCVIDIVPREWTENDLATLRELVPLVLTELTLHLVTNELAACRARLTAS